MTDDDAELWDRGEVSHGEPDHVYLQPAPAQKVEALVDEGIALNREEGWYMLLDSGDINLDDDDLPEDIAKKIGLT